MTDRDPMILLPELLADRTDGEDAVLDLRVPEGLAYFAGHFPAVPIVPGVVQITWAVHFARRQFGLALPFRHLENVKFKELMRPGQRLELRLQYAAAAAKVRFCYRSEKHEHSSGRIYFHDGAL
jgi:3-hydroxymyristoyl/3-hydroxydecanoyl-(acyl carrier protein) dehydratase